MSAPERGMRELVVQLPPRWLRDRDFEDLVRAHDYRAVLRRGTSVVVEFAPETKVAAHTGLWLLSFFNQLASAGGARLRLQFSSEEGLFGYLERNGFIDLLAREIETFPERPSVSSAVMYRGHSGNLVETQELRPGTSGYPRQQIVRSLVDKLVNHYVVNRRTRRLEQAAFTALGELVDNVFSHSQTQVPGYAILQAYPRSEGVHIAVSDSGVGIPQSIRAARGRRVGNMSDAEVIIAAFQDGLSRHGDTGGRGCGLPTCARLAAQYGSDVIVRTPSARVTLSPDFQLRSLQAEFDADCSGLAGTHVCLKFRVDKYRGGPV